MDWRAIGLRHNISVDYARHARPRSGVRFTPESGQRADIAGCPLCYYHGKSVKEVAEIVGINEATVKTRMFYARKKLAELIANA